MLSQCRPSANHTTAADAHARVNADWLLEDKSTNGTFIDGQRVDADHAHKLCSGQEFVLGDDISGDGVRLRFVIPEDDGDAYVYVVGAKASGVPRAVKSSP